MKQEKGEACFVKKLCLFFWFLWTNLKYHAGKVVVSELKVPLIVEFEQSRTVRVVLFQMQVVHFRFVGRMSALFAHVHLSMIGKQVIIDFIERKTLAGCFVRVPLLASPCIGTGVQLRAPSSSVTRGNTFAWRISRTGRTCRAAHLWPMSNRLNVNFWW